VPEDPLAMRNKCSSIGKEKPLASMPKFTTIWGNPLSTGGSDSRAFGNGGDGEFNLSEAWWRWEVAT